MPQQVVLTNSVGLCVETFGDAGDPPILLIGGAGSSMDWWDDEFCARLAAGLRFVIRYDSRDTGRSTSYEAGAPQYNFADLAADTLSLLDALTVGTAHVVGISMGGMVAQWLAVEQRHRVESLTLISTSPAGPGGPSNELPAMSADLQQYFAEERPAPDWTDRAAVIDYIVASQRPFAGSRGFDEASLRERAGRIFDRTRNIAASWTNHYLIEGGDPVRSRLGEVTAPTLVIHGTEDPLFPYGHAEALAREIPDARLLPLEGLGHQMPPPLDWEVVVPAILRHTSGGWEEQGDRLASRSLTASDPTGWFERLYGAAAAREVAMPWSRAHPHPLLVQWAQTRGLTGNGRRAIIVGCGLGADAEYIEGLGFDTVAFDIADTAIRLARERFGDSNVHYVAADLLDPPQTWLRAFDLVVEIMTVQALPDPPRTIALVNVGRLVGPGGTLIAIAAAHDERDLLVDGPPWPLTRTEVEAFATDHLMPIRIEDVADPRQPSDHRWRAEFRRTQ